MDPCDKCEEMLQPFLDRELTDAEIHEAEAHLDIPARTAASATRFEVSLRRYVRSAWDESMPPELKAKLSALRTPLPTGV